MSCFISVKWFSKLCNISFAIAEFYVMLTVHLSMILVSNQPDAQLFSAYVYFSSLHVSSNPVIISRRITGRSILGIGPLCPLNTGLDRPNSQSLLRLPRFELQPLQPVACSCIREFISHPDIFPGFRGFPRQKSG